MISAQLKHTFHTSVFKQHRISSVVEVIHSFYVLCVVSTRTSSLLSTDILGTGQFLYIQYRIRV